MTSSRTDATTALSLSQRDAQWVTATLEVIATILGAASDDIIAYNINSLVQLFNEQYSAVEANALTLRAHTLLPSDTEISFIDGPFMVPASPMIQ